MNRSAPIAAARVAPCAMRRRARNDRCEASRSFHAALLRIHVVPLRITDGQMDRWRGRRNTTSRNNFLLKLKKPAKPALQGSAKRFDAL
ncbi:putative oxidoreductase alpha (Molybdopterin) subunit [Burkholderia mallei]|nr:putative oxidoreductase alpha (Molybdopterin) subunit [Burkholderia mallei]KOS76220.1 putative oxidoreductase alpha (Molybdopterin) subunit [Burkholderia mallei]KOS94217.1 putative oxidoreductase alpha (Molybdopterin) subunit [Burkholderia mallei]KOS95267.1 putative oxidoreductase alpha (Molybdopterin) subunit [Burkholderia mallei]KOT02179.1 putative oxidoreductase alpha (Molybdopterin) subunit [Burkholderia mallei]